MNLKSHHAVFYNNIKQNLSKNLNEKIIIQLASLLALDHNNRFKDKIPIRDYAQTTTNRLKNFLDEKIIDNDDFSNIIKLFIVAITPDINSEQFFVDHTRSIEASADIIINTHFHKYEKADLIKIKSMLIEMLSNSGIDKTAEFINSDPKIFKSYIDSNLQKNVNHISLSEKTSSIHKIINSTNLLKKKVDRFKQTATKIGLAFGLLSVAALALVTGGVIAPIFLVPALLVTVKIAPKIGASLGEALMKVDYSIKSDLKMINSSKNDLTKNIMLGTQVGGVALETPVQDRMIDSQLQDINHLKDNLELHINKQPQDYFLGKTDSSKQSSKSRVR